MTINMKDLLLNPNPLLVLAPPSVALALPNDNYNTFMVDCAQSIYLLCVADMHNNEST